MKKLFGTNGIRGIFSEDFTLEFIHDITLAIATFFQDGPIIVGYDGRHSSPLISKLVCSTLNYAGLDCKLAGLVPTPCLEYATKTLGYEGGIMITASHNPPEYNGIKPVANDGVEISRDDEKAIEEIYYNKKWIKTPSQWGVTQKENKTISTYLNGIKKQINVKRIISKNFKVAIDFGNGAQIVTANRLCEELGCEVIPINETIDGSFPGRGSEPTPENLEQLSSKIIKTGADIGVAFDGDGDRSIFCDNEGKVLTGDKSALVLSKFILEKNPKSTVVTCLNSGSSIEKIAQQTDSRVIRTKVGSVEVSRKMVPLNSILGFEENGGFMYGPHNKVRDGAMTLALALDLLSSSGKSLSEHLKSIPSSFTKKDKISCSKEDIVRIIQTLKEENPESDTTDGIKINFDANNWVMIRPSGTEPIARIYSEGNSQENLDKIFSRYLKKIKSIVTR